MTGIGHGWRRIPQSMQWALVSASLVVFCGLLVIALSLSVTANKHADAGIADAKHAAAQAQQAAQRAEAVARCVNRTLGDRNAPATRDANAHIAFANSLAHFFELPPQAAAHAEPALKRAVLRYAQRLGADQADRQRHPLGRC